jgi:hypothetical protein
MPVDFDGLVNKSVTDPAIFGKAITYTPQNGAPFTLNVVFDEAWQTVEGSGRRGISLPVSTTKPVFGARKSDCPAGVEPAQGDSCVIDGTTYEVGDVQPDGVSNWLYVFLN